MKKVITAIGNEILNIKLREIDEIIVKERDILYCDGILEFLDKDSDVDIIVINEEIIENDLLDFLEQIANMNIEIYLIISQRHFMEEFEKVKNVRLFNNDIEVFNVFTNGEYDGSYSYVEGLELDKRVISVIGNYGVGKTVFCSLLGKYMSKNYKVLLINFDIFSDNLKCLFDLKSSVVSSEVKKLVNKVCKNLYILNGLKYIFNEYNKISEHKVKEIFDELKKEYDFIIVDTSSEISLKFIKTIFPTCDYNIFLIEANLLELKKAKELLEVYIMDLGLDPKKTGLFINKYNISSIELEVIKNVMNNIRIIGKMNYSTKINSYINTNTKTIFNIEDIKKISKFIKS